jgi:hypothetical protein
MEVMLRAQFSVFGHLKFENLPISIAYGTLARSSSE